MKKSAFSLVELMVTLIVVSCIAAALSPVITKKLKTSSILAGSGSGAVGGGSSDVKTDCTSISPFCNVCDEDNCFKCDNFCPSEQFLNVSDCTCKPCPSHCVGCQTASICLNCKLGYYLKDGVCKPCPQGATCSGASPDFLCIAGYYKNGDICSPCPSGKYSNEGALVCSSCSEKWADCEKCTYLGCSKCIDGLEVLADGTCGSLSLGFTYTGSYSETTSATGKTKLLLKSSGTFTPKASARVTVYVIGGGGAGACYGGGGGGGGCINQSMVTLSANTPYDVVVGAGGAPGGTAGLGGTGGKSSFGTISAEGGTGGKGGSRGTTGGTGSSAGGDACANGADGTEIDGVFYAGGGGGSGSQWCTDGKGGKGGGGKGSSTSGTSGTPNTGGGGGGAGPSNTCYVQGSGGSGLVIMIL